MACALFPLLPACAQGPSSSSTGTYVWKTTDASGNITAQSPTFSGGQWYDIYYQPNGPIGYESSDSGNGGSTGTGESSGQTSSSGTVTATFTWHPATGQTLQTDPAPQCVVEQIGAAQWYGQGPFTTQPSCSDGLGDPEINGRSSGTLYSVQPPDSGGVITVKLSGAQANIYPVNTWGSTFSSGVQWTVNIYPLTVNLTGGIGSSAAKRLLIGQQLTATLSTGLLTQTSWNWGASSGEPFKNYIASVANAVYTPLGYETQSQLVCYFAQPTTSASVNCSAHVAVPSGASPASGLDLMANQSLTVEKPNAQLDVSIGTVTDLPTSTNPADVQLQQTYQASPTGEAQGISWSGQITTPADYVSSGNYGSWNWTQLIAAQRQLKNNGVYWQFAVDITNPATIINGVTVLDGMYPYGDQNGGFWYPSNGVADGNSDSPFQGLDGSVLIREYDVSDHFNDYLMYLPPGSGSLPVPMKRTDWYWEFQALKDAPNNWSTSGENAQWGFVSDFPAFPTWTFCAEIGHLVYTAP